MKKSQYVVRLRGIPPTKVSARPEHAIAIAKAESAKHDFEVLQYLQNQTIATLTYCDDRLRFWFSSACLEIAIHAGEFVLTVEKNVQNISKPTDSALLPLSLVMHGQSWVWDRDKLAKLLIGKTIENVFCNGSEMYLYFSDQIIISVIPVQTEEDNRLMLYWDLSD